MRGFALGLGVRCEFCHVGEPGQPLSAFDFAADKKKTKLKAREMLKMVRAINDDHLAGMDERSSPPIDVTCVTCHHGNSRPVTIQHVMLQDDRGKRSRFGNPRVSRSSGRVLREFHVRLHGVHARRCCFAAWGSSKGNRGDSCSPEPKSGVFSRIREQPYRARSSAVGKQ